MTDWNKTALQEAIDYLSDSPLLRDQRSDVFITTYLAGVRAGLERAVEICVEAEFPGGCKWMAQRLEADIREEIP